MKIDNLELNKEYTWKEICELVGIKCRSGKGKQMDFNKLKTLAEENKGIIEIIGMGKGTRYIYRHQNFANYTTIKGNNNTIGADMAKKGDDINKNEIIWSNGQNKSIITDEPLYFEGEDEDTLFFQIEKNKHKLKLYNYYTYKKLTEILGIKYHGKNEHSKEKQISIIMQQIQLLKEGNKYKVVRIYRVPMFRALGNIDAKNGQLYGNMLLFALVKYITENKKAKKFIDKHNYMFFGRPYLYEQMELCNKQYNEFRYKHKELHEETKVPKDSICDFYGYTNTQMKTTLQKALKNLASRHIIKYDDKNATCIVDKYGNRRLATHKEIGAIVEAEAEVKKQIGLNNLSSFINSGNGKVFYNMVNKYIKQQIMNKNKKYISFGENFDKCYKVVLIYGTRRSLEIGYEELIDDIELSLLSANDNFVDINLKYFNNVDIEKKQIVITKGFGKEAHKKSVEEAKYEYLQGIYLLLEKLIENNNSIYAYKEAEKYNPKKERKNIL